MRLLGSIVAAVLLVSTPSLADATSDGANYGQAVFASKACRGVRMTKTAAELKARYQDDPAEFREFQERAALVALMMANCKLLPTRSACDKKIAEECQSAWDDVGPDGAKDRDLITDEPDRPDVVKQRNAKAESAAEKMAKCVDEVLERARGALVGAPPVRDSENKQYIEFDGLVRGGLIACGFTERHVSIFGRLSSLDHDVFFERTKCGKKLRKSKAMESESFYNFVQWRVPGADSQNHPYLLAIDRAESDVGKGSDKSERACRFMVEEFGPNGSLFPGMVYVVK